MATTYETDEQERLDAYIALERATREGTLHEQKKALARLRSLKLRFLRDMRLQATEGALAHAGVQPSTWAARHLCKAVFGQAAAMAELVLRFAEHRPDGDQKRTAAERSDMALIDVFLKTEVPDALRAELAIETAKYQAHGQLLRMRARTSLGLAGAFKGGLRPLDD